jgi:anti-sigma B factor antagonist
VAGCLVTWHLQERMSFFYISDDTTLEGVGFGDDVAVLVAGGEIDHAASPQLRRCIDDCIDAGGRRLVLDLSPVSFIDSTAIGVLVGAVLRLHELGEGSLAVVCADENQRVQRIFEIAGIDGLIGLRHSRAGALSALSAAE